MLFVCRYLVITVFCHFEEMGGGGSLYTYIVLGVWRKWLTGTYSTVGHGTLRYGRSVDKGFVRNLFG